MKSIHSKYQLRMMMTDENTDFQSSKSEISTLLSTLQEKLNAMIETIPENDGNLKKKEFEGFLIEFKVLSNKWGNLT
jgi:hypothetical protein